MSDELTPDSHPNPDEASPWQPALADVDTTEGAADTEPVDGPVAQPDEPSPAPAERRRMWLLGLAVAALMIASGMVGGLIGARWGDDGGGSTRRVAVSSNADPAGPVDVAAVAEALTPSVVNVSALSDGAVVGVGTGVVVGDDGEIVTNAHVVQDAETLTVRLPGESEPRPATLVGIDAANDLALVRIDASGLAPVVFADPASVVIGEPVVVIGNALDLDGGATVTSGVVSGLERTLSTVDGALGGLVQTDAAISSGNSGGPLVNARGEVVGIVTAIARSSTSRAATNVGFAIPASRVVALLDQLRSGVPRVEGYLGVTIENRVDGGSGALITSVADDSPAAVAGFEEGDVVIAAGGEPIAGQAGLVAVIRNSAPGTELTLDVLRDGERITLTATLVERPAN